jgi:hypothetical protein
MWFLNNMTDQKFLFLFQFCPSVLCFLKNVAQSPLVIFHRGEKQNTSHYKAYCKGCVHHYVTEAKLRDQFGGQELLALRSPSIAINVEAALMEALAEAEEDERLDDGAVEICSDEEYNG